LRAARERATLLLFFFILLIVIVPSPVYADELIVSTNNSSYSLGATIDVFGSLTLLGYPVTNGLVAVQAEDDSGNLRLIRVVSTGQAPPSCEVRITGFLSCDYEGNPKSSFDRGEFASFKVSVESLVSYDLPITIFFNLFDSVGRSTIASFHARSLTSGELFSYTESILISSDFFPGAAMCYVNVLTGNVQPAIPKLDGYPCCPEESVEITVTGTEAQATSFESELSIGSEGYYGLSFKLPDTAALGRYDVYARARYNAWASVEFDYFWLYTDVNRDGEVNILDVSAPAKAFGSKKGDSDYYSLADINGDRLINILDIAAVALDYGKVMT
jgi:hypothetical protein